jgi:hypothetical protein
MKKLKIQGFFRKAWLCPCLIVLLTSCATLQKPAQESGRYRVTLAIARGNYESDLTTVLNTLPIYGLDYRPSLVQFNLMANSQSLIQFTVNNKDVIDHLQQNLQTAGIAVTGFHIERIN